MKDRMDNNQGTLWMFTETQKSFLDWASLGAAGAVFLGMLPAISMLVTIIYGLIRIYETETIQRLVGNRRKHGSKRTNDSADL